MSDRLVEQIAEAMPKCKACGKPLPTRSWGAYCACGEPTHPLFTRKGGG